jgi:hypothetical protein
VFCRNLFEQWKHTSGVPQLPRSAREPLRELPNPNSSPAHLSQSKQFINSFVSNRSAVARAQSLCFDRHPFFTGGRGRYQDCQQRWRYLAINIADGLGRPSLHSRLLSTARDSNRLIDTVLNYRLPTTNCRLASLTPVLAALTRYCTNSPKAAGMKASATEFAGSTRRTGSEGRRYIGSYGEGLR